MYIWVLASHIALQRPDFSIIAMTVLQLSRASTVSYRGRKTRGESGQTCDSDGKPYIDYIPLVFFFFHAIPASALNDNISERILHNFHHSHLIAPSLSEKLLSQSSKE